MKKYSYVDIKNSVNRVDSWWSRLVLRHPGSWALYLVANYTNWTPNFLSTLSFVFTLITGALFIENYWILGALTFQISLLFDFIDGRLARLTGNGSYFGEFLDNLYDQLKVYILPVAIYIGYLKYLPDEMNSIFIISIITYIFVQELSVILWLFVEKNIDNKNKSHIAFEKATESSYIGKLMTYVTKKFDTIGLRVMWTNIETNVIVFSVLPIMLAFGEELFHIANALLILYIIPEAYVVVKIIRAKDKQII